MSLRAALLVLLLAASLVPRSALDAPTLQALAPAPEHPAPPTSLGLTTEEQAYLDARGPVLMVHNTASPPLSFGDVAIGGSGIVPDLRRLMEVRLGLRFQLVPAANGTEMIRMMLSGEAEVAGTVARSPDRAEVLAFTDTYMVLETWAWGPAESDAAAEADFAGQILAVVGRSTQEAAAGKAFPAATLLAVPSTRAALEAVADGRAKAMVGSLPVIAYESARDARFQHLGPLGHSLDAVAIGFSVQRDDPVLFGIVGKALASISPQERAAIFVKWTGRDLSPVAPVAPAPPSVPVETVLLGAAVIGGSAVAAGVALWIHTLRRQVAARTRELRGLNADLEHRVVLQTADLEAALREQRLRREAEQEREAALAALRESETRLRDIVEHSTNLFYAHDAQNRLTYVSPNAMAFFGVPPGEALRRWTDFVTDHPANALAMERTEAALRTGQVQPPYEVELRHRDGHTLWVEVHEAPVVKDGAVTGMVGSFADITPRKRAEAAEREAGRASDKIRGLEEMNRFRVQFLNTAAHELNTPLTPLALELNLLADGKFGPLAPRQEKAVRMLRRNLQRLGHLVGDLLDAARLQAGKVPLARREVDLAELAREQGEVHGEAAKAAGVALRLDLHGAPVVQADPGRMAQVLSNLVANAVKFTPAGGEVVIAVARRGDHAEVTVADTGIGLGEAQMARLFQPFTQVHDAAQVPRGGAGTGLGLYISRGLVEEHGGRLWAESDGPGKGARFTFTLPLAAAEAPRPAERPEQRRGAAAAEVAKQGG